MKYYTKKKIFFHSKLSDIEIKLSKLKWSILNKRNSLVAGHHKRWE